MKAAQLTLIFLTATILAASLAHAGDGRIPIYEVPTVIDEPGSYYVTRDFTYFKSDVLITIASDDVTIDLAGHTLRTTGAASVIASTNHPTNVKIFGGNLIGGLHGIHLHNTTGARFDVKLSDVNVTGTSASGIYVRSGDLVVARSNVVIRDVEVTGSGSHGVHLQAVKSGSLMNCSIADSQGSGIAVEDSRDIYFRDNVSVANQGDGLNALAGNGLVVEKNYFGQNDGYGLNFVGTTGGSMNCFYDNRYLNNVLGTVTVNSPFVNFQCPSDDF